MKLMKTVLASIAGAALLSSASAAVLQITLTGSNDFGEDGTKAFTAVFNWNGYTIDQTYSGINSGVTLTSFNIDGNPVEFTPDTINMSLVIGGSGTTASLVGGSSFDLADFVNGLGIAGATQGSAGFGLGDGGLYIAGDAFNPSLTATPVPEPETYAAVAGAGLVAFGLFRRRAVKA